MRKKGERLIEGQYYNLIQFCFNQGNLPLVKYFQTLYPINLSADEGKTCFLCFLLFNLNF